MRRSSMWELTHGSFSSRFFEQVVHVHVSCSVNEEVLFTADANTILLLLSPFRNVFPSMWIEEFAEWYEIAVGKCWCVSATSCYLWHKNCSESWNGSRERKCFPSHNCYSLTTVFSDNEGCFREDIRSPVLVGLLHDAKINKVGKLLKSIGSCFNIAGKLLSGVQVW